MEVALGADGWSSRPAPDVGGLSAKERVSRPLVFEARDWNHGVLVGAIQRLGLEISAENAAACALTARGRASECPQQNDGRDQRQHFRHFDHS